jgi:hypothetical protein
MKLAFDRAAALMASTTEQIGRPSSSFVVYRFAPSWAPRSSSRSWR